MKKEVYFDNLDALRFFSFLSVFFYHSFPTKFNEISDSWIYTFLKVDVLGNANLGVNFFFVLSGFLIVYLLVLENEVEGRIRLEIFYAKRVLRIWPLYFLCVVFGFFIFPYLKMYFGETPNETANIENYLLFISNIEVVKKGLPDSSALGLLWSVAVEFQFYLVIPFLVAILSKRSLLVSFGLVILLSIFFRWQNDFYSFHEYHTLSCMGDLAIGGLGGMLVFYSNGFVERIRNINRVQLWILYTLMIIIFFFQDEMSASVPFLRYSERIIAGLIFLLVILEQVYCQSSIIKFGKFKWVSFLGTLTYGFYCLHKIAILIVTHSLGLTGFNKEPWQVYFLETILVFVLTLLLGLLSFYYFEKPFLQLKSKLNHLKLSNE